jgi:AcrR family transcriptional regulator
MSPRPKVLTDDEILEATARAIGRAGPARLTLNDVGEEAGLSPATLVQRFGSKHGLLVAFARRSAEAVTAEIAAVRAGAPSPLAAVLDLATTRTAHARTPEALTNHLAFFQLDLTEPDLRGHAVAYARSLRLAIHALLDEAVAAGELAPCDTAALARAVEAMLNGSPLTWALHREGDVDAATRADLATLLAGYRPSAGRPG